MTRGWSVASAIWAAVVAGSIAALPGGVAVARPNSHISISPAPSAFQLRVGEVIQGWRVTAVRTSRWESNWWAWHDSHPARIYFYRHSWSSLGRTAGWFEKLDLSSGITEVQAAILVSVFRSVSDAQHAYHAILPDASTLVPLHIGANAAEWATTGGVGSGPHGLTGYFGTYTTFVQKRSMVAEIFASVGGEPGAILRTLHNPGRAIAPHLASIS